MEGVLRATVVLLAVMLMSRRATRALLADMFAVQISTGSIDSILKGASDALAAPWEAIKRAAQSADVAHADETSWRRAGQRLWLWGALTRRRAAIRSIAPARVRPRGGCWAALTGC